MGGTARRSRLAVLWSRSHTGRPVVSAVRIGAGPKWRDCIDARLKRIFRRNFGGNRASGLELEPAANRDHAAALAQSRGFAYLPLEALSPEMADLLRMRRLFGLRSPVNTVARLLNPGDAPASVDGVFHPPYLAVHLGVAELLGRQRLFVLKGGGGEAERVPLKPATGWLWDKTLGRSEIALPARQGLAPLTPATDTPALLAAVWRGEMTPPTAVATIIATIALGLLALGWAATAEDAERDAERIWRDRLLLIPVGSGERRLRPAHPWWCATHAACLIRDAARRGDSECDAPDR